MKRTSITKRAIALMLSVMLVATLFSGCGNKNANTSGDDSTNANPDTVYEIKIANTVSESDPINMGYKIFKEEVETASNGRFKVTIYPNGTLAGTDADCMDKVNTHVIQLASAPPTTFATVSNGFEDAGGLHLIMLASSAEELYKLSDSDWFQNLFREFEKTTGVKVYGSFLCGWVCPSLSGKAVTSLDDFKGMKLRMAGKKDVLAFYEELGFTTVNVAFNETFAAIQQKMVDGLFTPLALYKTSGFWEVVDSVGYYAATPSFHEYVVDGAWYDTLPADLQQIFDEAMANLQTNTRRFESEAVDETLAFLKEKNITVYTPTEAEMAEMEEIARTKIWGHDDVCAFSKDTINIWLDILGKEPI